MSQDSRRHPNEILIERLMQVNEQLVRQNDALAAILVAALGQAHNPYLIDPRYTGQPTMVVPEDEVIEDARAMLDEGMIDTTEFQKILRSAGFDSANIDIT